MFAGRYFGARYFGSHYFGKVGGGAAGSGTTYFGHRYFGAPYFAPIYFGGAAGSAPPPVSLLALLDVHGNITAAEFEILAGVSNNG